MKRVKLAVNYGKKKHGSIVELNDEQLEEVGEGNYVEVGEEVSADSGDTLATAQLDETIQKLQGDLDTKDEEIQKLQGDLDKVQTELDGLNESDLRAVNDVRDIIDELKQAKKIADYEAIVAKYATEA